MNGINDKIASPCEYLKKDDNESDADGDHVKPIDDDRHEYGPFRKNDVLRNLPIF